MYEGAPDWPEPDRVWASVERHRVNVLGRLADADPGAASTAGRRAPAPSTTSRACGCSARPASRGTRSPTGGCPRWSAAAACRSSTSPAAPRSAPASSRPIRSRRSRCARSAAPRTAWTSTCSTPTGNPVRGEVGELVCKRPWPGMTRGIWGDPERYMETYWSMYPDVWRHGDWALIDDDGDWYLLGRSDDTINVAGKRLGPAEVESVLVSHPAVAESAVVGVPDETKGEAIWCFCVVADGAGDEHGRGAARAGRAASWAARSSRRASCSSTALPKTRSAKILRRAVRAVAVGEDPGDMSSRREPAGARRHPRRARLRRYWAAARGRRSAATASSISRTRRSTVSVARSTASGSTFSGVSDGRWECAMRPRSSRQRDRDRGMALRRGRGRVGADAPDVALRARSLAQAREPLVVADQRSRSPRRPRGSTSPVADALHVHEVRRYAAQRRRRAP